MSAPNVLTSVGKADTAARKRATRAGRRRGCYIYITADELGRAGFASDSPAPWYRVWGGQRGRYVVVLYSEA